MLFLFIPKYNINMSSYESMLALPTRIMKQLEEAPDLETVKRTIGNIHIKQLNNVHLSQNKLPLDKETVLNKLNFGFNDVNRPSEASITEIDTNTKQPSGDAAIDFIPSRIIHPVGDVENKESGQKIESINKNETVVPSNLPDVLDIMQQQNEMEQETSNLSIQPELGSVNTEDKNIELESTEEKKVEAERQTESPFKNWISKPRTKPINPKHAEVYKGMMTRQRKAKMKSINKEQSESETTSPLPQDFVFDKDLFATKPRTEIPQISEQKSSPVEVEEKPEPKQSSAEEEDKKVETKIESKGSNQDTSKSDSESPFKNWISKPRTEPIIPKHAEVYKGMMTRQRKAKLKTVNQEQSGSELDVRKASNKNKSSVKRKVKEVQTSSTKSVKRKISDDIDDTVTRDAKKRKEEVQNILGI